MEYGDVFWGDCTKDNSELLEKIQIEAARIITGLSVNSSISNLYSELAWEPLQARRDKHNLKLFHTLFYKTTNGIAPQYMSLSSYETVFNKGILFHNRKDKHKRKLYYVNKENIALQF